MPDAYSYAYPELGGEVYQGRWGNPLGTLSLGWRGRTCSPDQLSPPTIVERVGVDLDPLRLDDPDARLWFRAFIPIEETLLIQVSELQRHLGVRLIQGRVQDVLKPIVSALPGGRLLVLQHTFLTTQMEASERDEISVLLRTVAKDRDFVVVSLEGDLEHGRNAELKLAFWTDGQERIVPAAVCEAALGVGRYMTWGAPWPVPRKTGL